MVVSGRALVGVVCVMAVGAGCSLPGSTMTVKGTLTITDPSGVTEEPMGSGACAGTGGYDDLTGGANVVIHDSSGDKVALGSLDVGEFSSDSQECVFEFDVADVPDDGELYSISIGSRSPFDFNKSDADALALTIGD